MVVTRRSLFIPYLILHLCSSLVLAQSASTVLSLSPSLTASSTGSALDCTATTAANVSACYPNLNEIPVCVRPCLTNVTLSTPCASTDFRCLCSKSAQFQQETLACLAINGTCSTADIQTAVNFYYNYCTNMHYPLSAVPSPATSTVINTIISSIIAVTSTPSPSPSSTLLASSSNNNSTALTPGAKAGLGVGLTALFLVLVLVAAFFLWRHRTRRRINASRIDTRSYADNNSSRYADADSVYRSPGSAMFRSPSAAVYRSPSSSGAAAAAELEGKNVYQLSESSEYGSSGQAATVGNERSGVGEIPVGKKRTGTV